MPVHLRATQESGSAWDRRLAHNSDNSFDAVRLALATLVVLAHSILLPCKNYPCSYDPLYRFLGGHIDLGAAAVNGFFLLSGFLITRSWLLTNNTMQYFQKRVARLYPAFLLASLMSIAVGAFGADNAGAYLSEIKISRFMANVLSLQGFVGNAFQHNPVPFVNGTLWTIKYEFDCYILIAVLGISGFLSRATVTSILGLFGLAYVAQSFGYFNPPRWNHGIIALMLSSPEFWPRLFTYFFAGSAFYLWRATIPKSRALFCLAIIGLMAGFWLWVPSLALIVAGAYCMFTLALSTSAVFKFYGKRVDLSYGIYLYAFPIQQLIIAWSGQSISWLWLFILSISATSCIAFISWTLVEAPSLRWTWVTRRQDNSQLAAPGEIK